MTKETFLDLISAAKRWDAEIDRWNDFGICLFELPIADIGWEMFDIAIHDTFTEEGVDWINWWMFERGDNNPLDAYDEEDNVIPMDTPEDLWNEVSKYLKGIELDMPAPKSYPYYGKSNDGLIVLFTSEKKGTVVYNRNPDTTWKPGNSFDWWNEDSFEAIENPFE